MESTIVNARVPQGKCDLGASVLKSLDATTTDLINGAFDYLIENKAIPGRNTPRKAPESFSNFVAASTLNIDWGSHPGATDYKAILREGKQADYERLT